MTKPKVKPVTASDVEALLLPDAGALLYRDRAGKSLGGGPSEGKANFAAITDAALAMGEATVADEPEPIELPE
jgi:hypothetical protein